MGTDAQSRVQDQSQVGTADCTEAWTSSAFLYAQNAQVQLLQGFCRNGCRQSPEPQIQNLYPAPEDHNGYK